MPDLDLTSNIAASFLKEKIISVSPIVGYGSVNKIFSIQAETSRCVIRLNHEHEREKAFMDYQKEKWCLEKSQNLGISGPKVLAIGRIENRAYMIQSFLEGTNGKASECDPGIIWKEIGRFAKLIHSVRAKNFGEIFSEDLPVGIFGGGFNATWQKHLDYNVQSLSDKDPLLELGVFTPAQSTEAKKMLIRLQQQNFSFGLTHGDLALRNIIISSNGNVQLLDWGSAELHIVPHYDLVHILGCKLEQNDPNDAQLRAFLDGYGLSQAEFKAMQLDLDSLMLLRAFDKVRWALDRSPKRTDSLSGYAKKIVKMVLK